MVHRRSSGDAFTGMRHHGCHRANSERAIEMPAFVVLAFVRMRRAIAGNRNILTKLAGTLNAASKRTTPKYRI